MDLSVIVPTYNEEENIITLLTKLKKIFENLSYSYEILVVDDSSQDKTVSLAKDFFKKFDCGRVIIRKEKPGLASSVIEGIRCSSGDIIVIMDADLSHPPEYIPDLLKPLVKKKAEFVIASRYIKGGIIKEWSFIRRVFSQIATLLGRIFVPTIRDPLSGFFALKREAVKDKDFKVGGFKICLELIVKGDYKKIVEIPYIFVNRKEGESKLKIKTVLYYLCQLFNILLYKLRTILNA